MIVTPCAMTMSANIKKNLVFQERIKFLESKNRRLEDQITYGYGDGKLYLGNIKHFPCQPVLSLLRNYP